MVQIVMIILVLKNKQNYLKENLNSIEKVLKLKLFLVPIEKQKLNNLIKMVTKTL